MYICPIACLVLQFFFFPSLSSSCPASIVGKRGALSSRRATAFTGLIMMSRPVTSQCASHNKRGLSHPPSPLVLRAALARDCRREKGRKTRPEIDVSIWLALEFRLSVRTFRFFFFFKLEGSVLICSADFISPSLPGNGGVVVVVVGVRGGRGALHPVPLLLCSGYPTIWLGAANL